MAYQPISVSTPLFLQSAEDLATRLGRVDAPRANELEAEARELIAVFRRWQLGRPDDRERVVAIKQLLDLQRRAMDYLSGVERKTTVG